MKTRDRTPVYLAILALLLVLSIHGVIFLPAWNFRGLDFHNLHTFHNRCPEWPMPYGKTGQECGDVLGRPMLYPPLVYWFMAWTRFFNFYLAEILWSAAIPLLTILATYLVDRADGLLGTDRASSTGEKYARWIPYLWLLTFLQLPMVFAIERGNNDAAILPIYALAVYLFSRKKLFWSGFAMAAACWMKVYPVVPAFVLFAGLAFVRDLRRSTLLPLFKGFTVGGFAFLFLLLPDSVVYLTRVLPTIASDPGGFGTSSHSLFRGLPSLFLKLPLLALWIYFTRRIFRRDPVLAFTGALAIATFFPNLANDYNLITAYPFLFIVLKRWISPGLTLPRFAMLVLTLAAFVGDRTPLEALVPNHAALYTQIVWFIAFPIYVLNHYDERVGVDGKRE